MNGPKRVRLQFSILLVPVLVLLMPCQSLATDPFAKELVNQYATEFWNSFNEDLSSGDLDTYLSHWDDQAERITPSVHARGIDEIRLVYQNYLDKFENFHQTELRRVVEANIAVSELLTRARNKKTGEELELPNVAILEFTPEGRVQRARVYLDTAKFSP